MTTHWSSIPERTRATRERALLVALLSSAVLVAALGCRTPEGDTVAERRAHIRSTNTEILNAVYASQPFAKDQVAGSTGYATFSTFEMKLMVAGSGNGYGQATDRGSGKVTFMNVRKLHAGFGAGIQNLQTLFIFKKRETFNEFVAGGWTFGGGADASLKQQDEEGIDIGGQASLEADPIIYQVTEAGIALGLTGEGLKFSVDEELN
jgi:lipid-binding SYLF domain-containing protein